MNSNGQKVSLKSSVIFSTVAGSVLLILGYLFFAFNLIRANDSQVRQNIQQRTTWMTNNKQHMLFLFNNVFPLAIKCFERTPSELKQAINNDCQLEIRRLIDVNLSGTLGGDHRLPVYFIRLRSDQTIQKLYQSGIYTEKLVDTPGEQLAVKILNGEIEPNTFPQFTCCGGDDIVPQFPIIKHLLPIRRYLQDFPSEIELIFPVKDENNTIIGAVVYLYGD